VHLPLVPLLGAHPNASHTALVFYGCGLALGLLWSPLLHGAKLIGAAAAVRAAASLALGAAVPLLVVGVHPIAGMLLLPLFAWECSGARWTYLLWRLNHPTRGSGGQQHVDGRPRPTARGYNATIGEE